MKNQLWQKKKDWITVKLDDVDPNDIYYSLNQIKWFDYREYGEAKLIKVIKRKIEEIKKQKKK